MSLGEYISMYIEEHNLSIRAFAAQCGMSHSYITYIINGRTSRGKPPVLTIDMYKKLAAGMGVDVNELLAEVDDSIALPVSQAEEEFYEELQILRDNPETRALLKATRGMTAQDVKAMADFAKALRGGVNDS